jgi:hypothetical protein
MHLQLFWTTQILTVISLAIAKMSLVVLFQRITPKQIEPQTIRWLTSMVAIYTLLSLFLIAFQCKLPHPWILSPRYCSTHGNIYYPVTISNMLTDAVLAIWIFPIVWGLQMEVHTKSVISWLFGSRLLICLADIGRLLIIREALRSEDQTRKTSTFHIILAFASSVTDDISGSQLIWAIMDQIVVHLSINHATLPRIQNFLSHLQNGGMSFHMDATRSGLGPMSKRRSSAIQTGQSHSHGRAVEQASNNTWNSLRSRLTGSINRTPSISEQPLRFQPQTGIELSTIVYSGMGQLDQINLEQGRSAATSLSSEGLAREERAGGLGGVKVQTDVHMVYDKR